MPKTYIVMIARSGEIDWLCHVATPEDATAAMAEWLGQPERGDEDAAWVMPIIAFGQPGVGDRA